jgi:methionine synthase II (cobalamin-independent)
MKRSGSKILTTHVGSLPQPDGSWTNAATDEGKLRKTVGDVMAKQRELGLDVINDGEYAKGGDWLSYTDDRLNGFEAGVFAGTPLIAQGAAVRSSRTSIATRTSAGRYSMYAKAKRPPSARAGFVVARLVIVVRRRSSARSK